MTAVFIFDGLCFIKSLVTSWIVFPDWETSLTIINDSDSAPNFPSYLIILLDPSLIKKFPRLEKFL